MYKVNRFTTMRQYFYLVVAKYDESCYPQKIFLQKHEAIQWGRREATKSLLLTADLNTQYELYRQEINRTDTLERVKSLPPYPTKELVDAGLVMPTIGKGFGADFDIDKEKF